jgi:phage terminase large subunit-like protein
MKEWKLGALHEEWNELLNRHKGLVIKAPRSHLKTFFFFEARALQLCKLHPGIEIRYFTSADSMAVEKLDHVKDFLKLPYFQDMLEGTDTNNKTEIKFGNGSKIYVQGFMGKARGGHPDYIVIDDVIDSQVVYSDDWNRKTKERLATEILPMAEPHTQIIIIGTLQREDDIYSIDFSKISNFKWFSKSYDAIVDEENHITLYPEKWDWDNLMTKKQEITELVGSRWFDKEYRNIAVNLVGEIIKPEWRRNYSELPTGLSIYTGWDLSVGKDIDKGDYTAKVTFGLDPEQHIYIISIYRERIDFGKRIKAVINSGAIEKPIRIAIEDNVFQADTVQVAKHNSSLNIQGVKTTINKIEKYNQVLVPLFENGRVFLRVDDETHDLFWRELCSLPRGAHDDMADAFCVGLQGVLTAARFSFTFGDTTFDKTKQYLVVEKPKPGMMPEKIEHLLEEERKKLEREMDQKLHDQQVGRSARIGGERQDTDPNRPFWFS